MQNNNNLPEHRCENCRSLLFKGRIAEGNIEIKCNKCGEINSLIKESKIEIHTDLFAQGMFVTAEPFSVLKHVVF